MRTSITRRPAAGDRGHRPGRLSGVAGQSEAAVRLLGQVTATQPRRVTTASRRLDPVMLSTIIESAVPGIYRVAVFRRGLARSVPVELTLI